MSAHETGRALPRREACDVLMPEFRTHQRARVILQFVEEGEETHAGDEGWAQLNGPWLHWLSDENDEWQTWPIHNVLCIDWKTS